MGLYDPKLPAKPWWSSGDAPELQMLVDAFADVSMMKLLRDELSTAMQQRPRGWRHQPERIQQPGRGRWKEWKVLDDRNKPCRRALFPETCKVLVGLGRFVEVQWAEYSVLEPTAYIRPHTGPTNDRLTAHLCLATPKGGRMRLGDTAPVAYSEGSVFLFDDSFE